METTARLYPGGPGCTWHILICHQLTYRNCHHHSGCYSEAQIACRENYILWLDVTVLYRCSIMFYLVLYYCLRLKFPQIIVIYITTTSIIFELFLLIGYAGGDKLFCKSRDYIDVLNNSTGFCNAAGRLFQRDSHHVCQRNCVWYKHAS